MQCPVSMRVHMVRSSPISVQPKWLIIYKYICKTKLKGKWNSRPYVCSRNKRTVKNMANAQKKEQNFSLMDDLRFETTD